MRQDSQSTRPEEGLSPWRIAVLVSAAIAISYLDRQTLPVAVSAIAKEIPLSNQQFSALQSTFLFAYAFMYAGGGKLVDVLGTRRGFTVIMIFWSLACASHALATTFAMLAASRFLLGMGEGGAFPQRRAWWRNGFLPHNAPQRWESSTPEVRSAPSSRRRRLP